MRCGRSFGIASCIGFGLVLVVACLGSYEAFGRQVKQPTQYVGVDNTKMGPYKALAELTLDAFQKDDYPKAAELARILERTWDRGESGERAGDKPNHDLYNQIDRAMDAFIVPIMNYKSKAPDRAAVDSTFNEYLDKLNQVN